MNDLLALDDAVLLRRVAMGDATAFGVLYDRLAPMVLVRLRRRCADPELTADVLQESFTSAWRYADQWDGRGEVAAWMWTIAARRLVDAFRQRAVRDTTADRNAVLTHLVTAPSAEAEVVDGLLDGPLEAALDCLTPELRAVLQATVLDGLSTRETAVLLGIPERTVKARAYRARTAMRRELK